MPTNYLYPQRREATPAYASEYEGGYMPAGVSEASAWGDLPVEGGTGFTPATEYPGNLGNLPAMDWGVPTDNLPAYTQPAQMPSPQRGERYQTQYRPPTGSTTTTTETGQQIVSETGQQITTPLPPPGQAPTMGEMPGFQMPEDITLPGMGEMPGFALPEYGEVPEMQMPGAPKYPTFAEPARPSERKYVQEAAAPGVRELRRTTTQALSSANFAQNPIVQATIKEQILRGHGDALSQVMGMARREGGEKAERIYRGKFEAAKINYQGQITQARDTYQTKVMKAQTDWQGKMQALKDKWQGGLIKSQAEYGAAINDRRMKWMAEVDTIREKYRMSFSKSQAEYSAGINKVLAQFEADWRGYLAKFGQRVDITGQKVTDITGETISQMQYQYGTPGRGEAGGEFGPPTTYAQLYGDVTRESITAGAGGKEHWAGYGS